MIPAINWRVKWSEKYDATDPSTIRVKVGKSSPMSAIV